MNHHQAIELRECPFCGGAATLSEDGRHAICLECKTTPWVFVGAWNRRATPAPASEPVAAGLSSAQIETIRFAASALEGLDYEDTAGDLMDIVRATPAAQEVHPLTTKSVDRHEAANLTVKSTPQGAQAKPVPTWQERMTNARAVDPKCNFDALKAEFIGAELKELRAACKKVLPVSITKEEMAALERFHECATDGEGYDVAKEMMQRLAKIGLVRRVTANFYEHTEFGLAMLDEWVEAQPVSAEDREKP